MKRAELWGRGRHSSRATVLVPLLVKIDKRNVALLKDADYVGIALMALFLGCLEYVLEEGPRWDWFGDNTIWICAWISGLAGIGFVIRSLTLRGRSSICGLSQFATSRLVAGSHLSPASAYSARSI
jgi:hypothetical protein